MQVKQPYNNNHNTETSTWN